jgi:hypothetical protein
MTNEKATIPVALAREIAATDAEFQVVRGPG